MLRFMLQIFVESDHPVTGRVQDAGHRRGWAKALEAAIGHEREAITAMRVARESLA